jgi:4-amino-4-deoxy-L-arabinose transferase-like glycosyltransferase
MGRGRCVSRGHPGSGTKVKRYVWPTAGVAILALAGINFVGGVGASSLFVDEAFSWIVASHPLGDLYSQVKLSEVAPPGYYLLLHIWLEVGGSMTETWMRIPSAVAGMALVCATGWLCQLVAGPRAAVVGGLLVAVSPLVLTYAQQVRAYVFVMLAVTLAVALAFKAVQLQERRSIWLVASACCAVAAIWLHYTCLPVIAALVIWLLTRPELSARAKCVYGAVLLIAQAAVTPLLIHQASTGNPGADAYAHLNLTNAFAVLGNPVDGQYASHLLATFIAAGAIVAAACLFLVARRGDGTSWLLVAAAILPVLALFAVTIVAKPVMLSRYCTVATPFAVVLLAAAFAHAPRLGALPALAVAILAVIGSISVHQPKSHWPDVGGAYRTAGVRWRTSSDEFVLSAGIDPILTSGPLVIYYTERYLPPGVTPLVEPGSTELVSLFQQHRRLWLVGAPTPLTLANQILRPSGYHVALVRRFAGDEPLQVTLAVPG